MSAPTAGRDADLPISVTLVNDYEIIVHGLRQMLAPFSDTVQVVETEVGGTPERPTDVALFDTFAGRRQSLSRVRKMAADCDIRKVVLYTWDVPDRFASDISAQNIDGVILKSETGERLVDAIVRIHNGERLRPNVPGSGGRVMTLTEREREVLALLAQGLSNPQIADELYLSADTVKTHVRKLFSKLGVGNRTQAALLASDHGVSPGRGPSDRRAG